MRLARDKKNFNELKDELYPFDLEDLLKLISESIDDLCRISFPDFAALSRYVRVTVPEKTQEHPTALLPSFPALPPGYAPSEVLCITPKFRG